MKNIQKQYNDLLEGKMSRENFMRNVRMQFPQFVSSTNSYEDSIRILKGKRILSESWSETTPGEKRRDWYSDIAAEMGSFEAAVEHLVDMGLSEKEARVIASEHFPESQDIDMHAEPKESLSESKLPEGVYGHNPNAEAQKSRGIDHLNYYQVYHGIQYELEKEAEITDETYIKVRKKVVDRILRDPDAYKELQLANFKAVKEIDKNLEMKDVTPANLKDKPNEMKVLKKDAGANTQDSLGKKEAKKAKNGKGLQHMTQTPKGKLEAFPTPGKEKVMALKEHILDEMTNVNPNHEYINVGSRVKKKNVTDYDDSKVGNVTKFDGDTATVKWDNGTEEHVQINILTKKDLPRPQDTSAMDRLPDLGQVTREAVQNSEDDAETKKAKLKEKLTKTIKELMFKKGNQAVTADAEQSKSALRQAGYREIPNTQDVRAI